jgi:hypothetical protein
MKNRSRRIKRNNGSAISEFAASLAFVIPITMVAAFVAFQVSQIFMIKVSLDNAAQTAARRLAIAYGKDPVTAMAFPENTFDQIKYLGIVKSGEQFSIPIGTKGWNTTANPPTVTVDVVFQGGKYGLDPFPNPDPLNLGSNFKITSRCVSRLE